MQENEFSPGRRYVTFDHVGEKVRESEYFLQSMERIHSAHVEHVVTRARPAFDSNGNLIARAFQYNFSAFLSAHRATRYYIIRVTSKLPGTKQWRNQIDADPVMEALHQLRDVDIHDETLNLRSTMTFTNLGEGQGQLSTSGLMLHRDTLAANKRLKKHPAAIDFLVARPILEIATDGLVSLKRVVDDGSKRGFLPVQRVYF